MVTVVAVNIENFKMLNSVAGRSRGDKALKEVTRRIVGVAGARAAVARVGGDEFLVVSDRLKVDEAHAMASAIEQSVRSTPVLQADPPYAPSREEWVGVPWYCHFYGPTDDHTYVLGCGDWAPPPVYPLPLADKPPLPPSLRISGIYVSLTVAVAVAGEGATTFESIWQAADEQLGRARKSKRQNRLENWRARSNQS